MTLTISLMVGARVGERPRRHGRSSIEAAHGDAQLRSRLTSSHSASSTARSAGVQVDAALASERLDRLEPAAELVRRGAQRSLRLDAEVAGDVDDREQQVADLVGDGAAGRRRACASTHLGRLLGDLRQRAVRRRASRSRPSPPCAARRTRSRATAATSATPSNTLVRCFSSRLIASQFASTVVGVRRPSTSPNTCGWRRTSLSWTPRATSAIVNRPSCSAIVAWNSIWYSRSPSSSTSVVVGRRVVRVERLRARRPPRRSPRAGSARGWRASAPDPTGTARAASAPAGGSGPARRRPARRGAGRRRT